MTSFVQMLQATSFLDSDSKEPFLFFLLRTQKDNRNKRSSWYLRMNQEKLANPSS